MKPSQWALGSREANEKTIAYAKRFGIQGLNDGLLVTCLLMPEVTPFVTPEEMRRNASTRMHSLARDQLLFAADLLDEIAFRNSYNIVAGEPRGGVRRAN